MKKVFFSLVLFSMASIIGSAQIPSAVEAKETPMEQASTHAVSKLPAPAMGAMSSLRSAQTVIWSEDFGGGFTSSNGTWNAGGQNASLVIPSTSGPTNFNFPIPTDFPTGSNGIALFDFDDNIPDDPNTGNGFANQPAEGLLTSPVIDLSGHPDVEIVFYQAIFHCCEIDFDAYLEISTDGGNTFPHQIAVDPVDRNQRHWNLGHGFRFSYDISNEIAANPGNVVIRFNWTSLSPDMNGQFTNHYFWMIDDIEIRALPSHSLLFTEYDGTPENHIIYPQGSPKYGNLHISQAVPIQFSSNAVNYGVEDQTNVALSVTITDEHGNVADSLSSSPLLILASGDTATFTDLTTSGSWTPTSTGTYTITYTMVSDSLSPGSPGSPMVNAYEIRVNDSAYNNNRYSYHFGEASEIDGYIGTNSTSAFVTEAISLPYTFPNPSPDTAGHVLIDSMTVPFSNLTDPTALIFWEIYDTTGGFGANGPQGNMVFDSLYTLDPSVKGNYYGFDFRQMRGGQLEPLALPSGGYYFVMSIALSDLDSVVQVGYSIEDFDTPYRMRRDDGSWFGGFIGVSTPIFMLHMSGSYNTFPNINFTATPTTGNIPLTVNFDASATSDPDGDTLTYSWDFGDGNLGSGNNTSNTYTTGGTYWAVLTVSDGQGATVTDSIEIVAVDPNNSIPIASFTATPDSGHAPLTVAFDASASSDADNHLLSCTWDFGDGSTDTGQTTNNTYNSIGNYWAVLSVDDGNGGTDMDSVEIIVSPVPNTPPTASFTAIPDSGSVPLPVQFNASASNDADGDLITYDWDFGDGNLGSGQAPVHIFDSIGTFMAVLTVDDGNGGTDQDSVQIIVTNEDPTAFFTATPDSGLAPLIVTFDASGSNDPNNHSLSYSWDFGNGANGTGETTSHTYTTPGTFCIVLTIDDGHGGTAQDSTCIQVLAPNSAPVVAFTASPDTGGAPLQVTFDASATTDPDGDPLTYLWDFGDGSTDTGLAPNHTYTIDSSRADTTYWAALTVDDGKGAIITDSTSIYVINDIGVSEHSSNQLAIYPNPTEGEIIISIEEGGAFTLEVTSVSGQLLFSESINVNSGQKLQKDFSHLSKGNYLIRISNKSFSSTQKITIK